MNTVVYLTSDVAVDCEFAVRCAVALRRNETLVHENVVLLLHREGVRVALADASERNRIADLLDRDVLVRAGATCLDARDLSREGVTPGVELVPSGVGELVRLQSAGYNCVKVP